MKSILTSKKLFLFNIILISVIAGFCLSFLVFSCGTPFTPESTVFAQDNTPMTVDGLEELQTSFRGVALKILPSVVELRVTENPGGESRQGSPFEFFFDRENDNRPLEPPQDTGLGSGAIVARQGDRYFVVTNDHVAGNAAGITVVLHDGTEYEGRLEGKDTRTDIAVVSFQTDDPDIPLGVYGDSDGLFVGDWVLAVGNPFGFASSVTAGIVSAKGRGGPAGNISDFIQTDAAINQGNSGGPLVNLRGEIVGINTWITTPTGVNVGLGFAMPINNVKKAISDIITDGSVRYGWLGVEIGDVEEHESVELLYGMKDGAIIHQVFDDSPAEDGGLMPGDVVMRINDNPVRDFKHLSRMVGDIAAGETAIFQIHRLGTVMTLDVTIGLRGSDDQIQRAYRDMWPGFTIAVVDEEIRKQHEFPADGLMVQEVHAGGMPQIAGIKPGDFVLAINGSKVKNLLDFYRYLNDTETEEFDFLLNRSGEEITIGVVKQ